MDNHQCLKFDAAGNCARHICRSFNVGNVTIGGTAPVSIQSMTNTDTRDRAATLDQIRSLASLGCEIIRVAVPDKAAVQALSGITAKSPLPVIADIHFDYRLALAALESGIAGLRINPGTMRSAEHRGEVAAASAASGIPVRIGINSGSLEDDILDSYGGCTSEALVASALRHCRFFEECGCSKIKVSLKSSKVTTTVAACRAFAARTDYPLHLGITEAGTLQTGTLKSAAGIGCLLLEGIGDTIRVSLTAPPEQEVVVAQKLLEAVGLREPNPEIVACPTCGRTEIDLFPIVEAVEKEVQSLKHSGHKFQIRKIAIMGCVVNGPGEARDADLGIAGGKNSGVLFKKGQVVSRLPESELQDALIKEIRKYID